jgi:hypothetical protein
MLASRDAYHAALRDAFAQAASQGCPTLFLSDPDFSDWPLGEPAVVEHLTRWALAHRRLTVLAGDYGNFYRMHPRWVAWRRQWAHVVTCRALEDEPLRVPSMLLAPGVVTVRLFDDVNYRASASTDPQDGLRAREHLDALLQHSCDAFPASVLGL